MQPRFLEQQLAAQVAERAAAGAGVIELARVRADIGTNDFMSLAGTSLLTASTMVALATSDSGWKSFTGSKLALFISSGVTALGPLLPRNSV